MNAKLTMIVHTLNAVRIMNAKTHVLTSFVVAELHAKQKLIELFVNVLQAYKATHWFPVLKLDVLLISNARITKSVITLHVHLPEKNANLCVETILVQRVLLVPQRIIEKFALATIHYKEMVTCLVLNVSNKLSVILLNFKTYNLLHLAYLMYSPFST